MSHHKAVSGIKGIYAYIIHGHEAVV